MCVIKSASNVRDKERFQMRSGFWATAQRTFGTNGDKTLRLDAEMSSDLYSLCRSIAGINDRYTKVLIYYVELWGHDP